MGLLEQIMLEVMQLTDPQKAKVLAFARAFRKKEDKDISALMESIVDENEEALKILAE